MRRRAVIAGAVAALVPAGGRAQAIRRHRVAILTMGADAGRPVFAAFREAMRALGRRDGEEVAIEIHLAAGDLERLTALARELARAKVDVIVADGGVATDAARTATGSIPIVALIGSDPVQRGVVASLARPGGNVTGVTIYSLDLGPKQVELLREVQPATTRLLLLSGLPDIVRTTAEAARRLGLDPVAVQASTPAEIEQALAMAALARYHGVIVMPDSVTASHRIEVVARINAASIPSIYPDRDFALAGGLMSYCTNISDVYRRLARYVDRILKGESPAELPIERPERIELVVNLRTAAATGLVVPPLLLARADEVIE